MSRAEEPVPTVSLPGTAGKTVTVYQLGGEDRDYASLLAFPPTTSDVREFEPTHPLRNLAWFEFAEGLDVYIVADEALASTADGGAAGPSSVPFLSDADDSLARACGLTDAAERRTTGWLCLVDQSGTVRSKWAVDTASFDLGTVHETVRRTIADTNR